MLIVSISGGFILGCLISRDFPRELGYVLGSLDLCWRCIIPFVSESDLLLQTELGMSLSQSGKETGLVFLMTQA